MEALTDDELSALIVACDEAEQTAWVACHATGDEPDGSVPPPPDPPWDRAGSSARKKLVDEKRRRADEKEDQALAATARDRDMTWPS